MDNRPREEKLIEAVEELKSRHFDWKDFNCGLAAATIAQSYCGKDHAEKFRPLCEGKFSALRLVKKAGGLDMIMDELGFERIPVSRAKRGDCVLVSPSGDYKTDALGIVYDGMRAIIPSKFGLAYVKVLDCKKAWRVDG